MPVVGGFVAQYEYRCDGSNNTRGLSPAELIAMATISISKYTEGTSDEEVKRLTYLANITDKGWLPPVPTAENHAMVLLPQDGVRAYVGTFDKTTGQINYKELSSESYTLAAGEFLAKNGYAASDSICVRVVPILNRDISTQFEIVKAQWILDNTTTKTEEDGTITTIEPTVTEEVIVVLKEEAERLVPAVELQLLKLGAEFIANITEPDDIVFANEKLIYSDNATWTPKALDDLGFLNVLNTIWLS